MNIIAHFLSMSTEMLYGLIAAVCSTIALGMFIRDISRGKARPYLWSWIIRIVIAAVAFTAQLFSGATYSLALSGTQLIGGLLLLTHILRRQGKLGKLDRTDTLAVGIAIIGVGVWILSGNAIYAVIGTITADIAATSMGVRAAFLKDTADSLVFWLLCLLAGLMAAMSAKGQPLAVTLVPAASCINACINIATIVLIRLRSKRPALLNPAEDEPA